MIPTRPKVQLALILRECFITDFDKPDKYSTTVKDGADLGMRRWHGRSSEVCLKMWDRIRRECEQFRGIYERIILLNLTGNPSEDYILRCTSLDFSECQQVMGPINYCINNPACHIRKPFRL